MKSFPCPFIGIGCNHLKKYILLLYTEKKSGYRATNKKNTEQVKKFKDYKLIYFTFWKRKKKHLQRKNMKDINPFFLFITVFLLEFFNYE